MFVAGFLAAVLWFLVGKRGQKEAWAVAGLLAFLVGWGFNIAEVAPRQVEATEYYTQCIPRVGTEPSCKAFPTHTKHWETPQHPFFESFLQTWLETPAEFFGILLGTGLARVVGARGEAPPRELEDPTE
jgi:hypothetical protein